MPMHEPNWVQTFRHYGLPLCYLVYANVILINCCDPFEPITEDEEYSFCDTAWIWLFRLNIWPPIQSTLFLFLTILLYRTPPVVDGKHDKDDVIHLTKVDALVLRIVTIGNYKKMVENSITYHNDLIRKYLDCRFFSIHLVTEKPLNLQQSFPDVKEIVVPKGYQAKTGSLGKARNLAYWSETNQLGDLPEDRTWIIDLDEDVILTKSFMKSLCEKFLKGKNERKIGLPQVIIKFNENSGYLNKLLQIHRFTGDLSLHWPYLEILNWAPLLCHGGCYVARADCSMDKNAECGTFCSISDDNAYILAMRAKNVKLEFIDGWFYEDAPPSFSSAIWQRVRWQRGHLYLLLFAPVTWSVKLGVFVAWLDGCVLVPLFFLARLIIVFAAMTDFCETFFPFEIDNVFIFSIVSAWIFATHSFSLIYGSWYLVPWREAIVFSLFTLTGIPLCILLFVGVSTAILSIGTAVQGMMSGKLSWKATEKSHH